MARQSRLVVPGLAHYVWLRAHNAQPVLADPLDRAAFLRALGTAAQGRAVQLHACALLDDEVHLLIRPENAAALGAVIQALGRRFVTSYNQRHARSGTLWDGRFRAAVLQPGEPTLLALLKIDRLAAGRDGCAPPRVRGSVASQGWMTDPREVWALGNTPFEREAAYRELLLRPSSGARDADLSAAVRSGHAFGSASFIDDLARTLQRPVARGRRGRPPGARVIADVSRPTR